MMPPWLRVVAQLNPLTYVVDALRELMVVGGRSTYGLMGCGRARAGACAAGRPRRARLSAFGA